MAFLNFMKKREELADDIDLDMPPEPPKMMGKEVSAEEPIDEELMPIKPEKGKIKAKVKKKEKLPEIPPLPEIEEELPSLPEEDLELPPPPSPLEVKKEKKGFFSFLKPKKAAEKLPLPEIGEELPEMPPLPEMWKEFPEIPPLSKEELPPLPEIEEEFPPLPEAEEKIPVTQKLKAPLPEIGAEPLKPGEKPMPKKEVKEEKPIKEKRFITINDFKKIQEDISSMKGVLKGIDGFFVKLEEVKGVGDKGYNELCNNLQDIQKKIMFVDKMLFKEGD